ncbi:hypothetical protein CMK11_08520 [Candidatus Poribacteria bacterium]|nr:hypothetical protein [Candidatus Poribacteria bacterium]
MSAPWQADLERFCGKMVDAIVGDPVLYRMVCDSPKLAKLLADRTAAANKVAADPTSMGDFERCVAALGAVQCEEEELDWIRDYGVRAWLVLGPILRDFTHHADFERIARSFIEAIATPENVTAFVDEAEPFIGRIFTPDRVKQVSHAIDEVLAEVLDPYSDSWWIELVEFAADLLSTPEGMPALASTTRWFLHQLISPERFEQARDWISNSFIDWAKEQSAWLAEEDLDVEQMAFWLSIAPNTMHKHIQTRSGTDAEVPVRLVKDKGGRGRGKYYISRGELFSWARAHWRSPKKRILFPA